MSNGGYAGLTARTVGSPMRIKTSDLIKVRLALMKDQGGICPICERKFSATVIACVDHNHETGHIRGALCKACNRFEGQVKNRVQMAGGSGQLAKYASNLAAYWAYHEEPKTKLLHPTHQTEEEKRLARNKRARERRLELKKKAT